MTRMGSDSPNLPYEVWFCIAEFVPREHLKRLIWVNKAFYDAGMNARYCVAKFASVDPPSMLRTLQHLRHPGVCFRVRALEFSCLRDIEDHLQLDVRRKPNATEEEYLANDMIHTLDVLPNITEYTIKWRNQSAFQYIFIPFLVAAWNRLSPKLRKVTVKVGVDVLQIFLPLCTSLPCLEHFKFTIRNSTGTHEQAMSNIQVVAPFINLSARTLRRLSLLTWSGTVSFSALYPLLTHFPHLRRFNANIPKHAPSSHQRGLNQFLLNHAATLKHVDILPSSWGTTPEWTVYWMNEHATQDGILVNLRSLHAPCPRRSFNLETITGCLRLSADTLTSLTLADCSLSGREIYTIIDLFAHRGKRGLDSLDLDVAALTVELIDRFACFLPGLRTLYLTFDTFGDQYHTSSSGYLCAAYFRANLRFHLDWNLVNIGLERAPRRRIRHGKKELQLLFAQRIPSIRYFWGVGAC